MAAEPTTLPEALQQLREARMALGAANATNCQTRLEQCAAVLQEHRDQLRTCLNAPVDCTKCQPEAEAYAQCKRDRETLVSQLKECSTRSPASPSVATPPPAPLSRPVLQNHNFSIPKVPEQRDDTYDGRSYTPPESWAVPAGAPVAVTPVRNNAASYGGKVASPDGPQMVALRNPRDRVRSVSAYIEQRVVGLVPGTPYTVYVRARNRNDGAGAGPNPLGVRPPPGRGTLEVAWNGVRLGTPAQPTHADWVLLAFPFLPTEDSGLLRLTNAIAGDESVLLLSIVVVM